MERSKELDLISKWWQGSSRCNIISSTTKRLLTRCKCSNSCTKMSIQDLKHLQSTSTFLMATYSTRGCLRSHSSSKWWVELMWTPLISHRQVCLTWGLTKRRRVQLAVGTAPVAPSQTIQNLHWHLRWPVIVTRQPQTLIQGVIHKAKVRWTCLRLHTRCTKQQISRAIRQTGCKLRRRPSGATCPLQVEAIINRVWPVSLQWNAKAHMGLSHMQEIKIIDEYQVPSIKQKQSEARLLLKQFNHY